MKKILILCAFFSISACTCKNIECDPCLKDSKPITEKISNESPYKNAIALCDDNAATAMKSDYSTLGIIAAAGNQVECYKKIAYEIIDKNYTNYGEDIKKGMDEYIDLAGKNAGMINRPDSCYPYCGTIVGILAANERLNAAQYYLKYLGDITSGDK